MKTLACTLSLAIVTALVGCSAEAPKPAAAPPATTTPMPGAGHEGAAPAGHAADPAAGAADPAAGAAAPAAGAAAEGEKKEEAAPPEKAPE